jgi:hypothetical protein
MPTILNAGRRGLISLFNRYERGAGEGREGGRCLVWMWLDG